MNKLFDPTYLNLEYLFNKIYQFFHNILDYLTITGALKDALFFLGMFFIIVITYCIVRLLEIRRKEHEYLQYEIAEYAHHQAEREKVAADPGGGVRNERWRNVLNYLASSNHSDWKLAVMEADAILEDLTDQLDIEGVNVGERLKTADREKFKTLDDAWEAHIVRNRIAHEGSKFELTQHEANRVVVLYENVFREFGYI